MKPNPDNDCYENRLIFSNDQARKIITLPTEQLTKLQPGTTPEQLINTNSENLLFTDEEYYEKIIKETSNGIITATQPINSLDLSNPEHQKIIKNRVICFSEELCHRLETLLMNHQNNLSQNIVDQFINMEINRQYLSTKVIIQYNSIINKKLENLFKKYNNSDQYFEIIQNTHFDNLTLLKNTATIKSINNNPNKEQIKKTSDGLNQAYPSIPELIDNPELVKQITIFTEWLSNEIQELTDPSLTTEQLLAKLIYNNLIDKLFNNSTNNKHKHTPKLSSEMANLLIKPYSTLLTTLNHQNPQILKQPPSLELVALIISDLTRLIIKIKSLNIHKGCKALINQQVSENQKLNIFDQAQKQLFLQYAISVLPDYPEEKIDFLKRFAKFICGQLKANNYNERDFNPENYDYIANTFYCHNKLIVNQMATKLTDKTFQAIMANNISASLNIDKTIAGTIVEKIIGKIIWLQEEIQKTPISKPRDPLNRTECFQCLERDLKNSINSSNIKTAEVNAQTTQKLTEIMLNILIEHIAIKTVSYNGMVNQQNIQNILTEVLKSFNYDNKVVQAVVNNIISIISQGY